jgi:type III secretory pathway component EscR
MMAAPSLGDSDVFEIIDHTTASPLERYVKRREMEAQRGFFLSSKNSALMEKKKKKKKIFVFFPPFFKVHR